MPSESESAAERLEQLFHEALQMAPAERPDFLDQACGTDVALRRSLDTLLRSMQDSTGQNAWNRPALWHEGISKAAKPESAALPATLGSYRLGDRLGAGGMGVVYKAHRDDDEFSKVVAIKILHGEGSDPELIRRFRQERQILAGLEHPNIARLLDGGSMPDGLPFLVMEIIDGIPIDRYVADARLPLSSLLALFRDICAAVSYAHAKLVVHRDLKPGNILVTSDGVPKLLDFGIAKLLDDSSTERTRTGAVALTPEYASPEQVRGEPVTTATDIYSLGVLLHRLITRRSPYRKTGNAIELAQVICSEEIEPLAVDPDLDNIVRMALRKEPERRYASVEQFSEDLRRYQEGYPVAARPDTRGYRAAKFVRRNRTLLAAGVLLILALSGGIAATAWQARLATRRFNDVRKLANSYLFEFHDAIRDLPGSTAARQLVAKRGLEYLDSLARESGGDKTLAFELASAYGKVAAVQGAPNFPSLGDRKGALSSYRKAQEILRRLSSASPGDTKIAVELANTNLSIGDLLHRTGDLQGAADSASQTIAVLEKQVATTPGNSEFLHMLAGAYLRLADLTGNPDLPNLGDPHTALALFQKALQLRRKLVDADPSNRQMRLWLGAVHAKVATVKVSLADNAGGAAAYHDALAIDDQLVREEPLNVVYRREVAVYSRSLALLFIRMKKFEEARQYGDRSAAIFEELAKADPNNVEAQEARADSMVSQGYILQTFNDREHALEHYEAAASLYADLRAKHPESLMTGARTAYQLVAGLATASGDIPKALRSVQKELEIDDRLLRLNPNDASARDNQGVAYMQFGKAHEVLAARQPAGPGRLAEWKAARNWYQQSCNTFQALRQKGALPPSHRQRADDATSGLARCDRALSHQAKP